MNESPVTPYKRLSVKCMLSLEKPFLGGAELKHLCEVRVRPLLAPSVGLRSKWAIFLMAVEQAGRAPHLLLGGAACRPPGKVKAALTGCWRTHLCSSVTGCRLMGCCQGGPEGVPKAFCPQTSLATLALIPVAGFRFP